MTPELKKAFALIENPEDLMTQTEAAMRSGVAVQAINHRIKSGRIPSYDQKGKRLVSFSDVINFSPLKSGPKNSQGSASSRYRHGCARTGNVDKTYHIWSSMKGRCLNPNDAAYDRYGGRGISVCSRWLNSFESFREDMGDKPDKMSLDRIDNSGNYEPSNCRWATIVEQNTNSRKNRLLTFNGKTQCMSLWSREMGISDSCLQSRLNRGLSVEDALTMPVDSRRWETRRRAALAKRSVTDGHESQESF